MEILQEFTMDSGGQKEHCLRIITTTFGQKAGWENVGASSEETVPGISSEQGGRLYILSRFHYFMVYVYNGILWDQISKTSWNVLRRWRAFLSSPMRGVLQIIWVFKSKERRQEATIWINLTWRR
jgi:hypothetical protein